MSALAPPGSTLWLLRHDLRLGVRGFLFPKKGAAGGRRRAVRMALAGLILLGAGGFVGFLLAGELHHVRITPSAPVYLGIDVALAWLWTLMVAQALTVSTQIFYERNDLDLLLSSPVAPRKVLTVRALGIAILAAALYLGLASLVVVPLAFAGHAEFLSVYVVILSLALLATAAGLALALALFAWIGPRRTRTISQIMAAVIGGAVFLGSQARNFLPTPMWRGLVERVSRLDTSGFSLDAPYAWPARAVLGDPVALLAVAGLSAGAFLVSTAATGRRFAADAAAGAGVATGGDARAAQRRAAAGDRARFSGGALSALVRKDVRLLVRDPWLISQMALQVLYLIPLTAIMFRFKGGGAAGLASGAAAITFVVGQLAGNLTWVVVSAEDAPELIACAPVAPGQVVRAKLTAALTPTLIVAALPVLGFLALSPLAAAGLAVGILGAAFSTAIMNVWYAKPANRREFRRSRRGTGFWPSLVELMIGLLWGATTWMLVAGFWPFAAIPILLVGGALALMRKPNRYGVALPD